MTSEISRINNNQLNRSFDSSSKPSASKFEDVVADGKVRFEKNIPEVEKRANETFQKLSVIKLYDNPDFSEKSDPKRDIDLVKDFIDWDNTPAWGSWETWGNSD